VSYSRVVSYQHVNIRNHDCCFRDSFDSIARQQDHNLEYHPPQCFQQVVELESPDAQIVDDEVVSDKNGIPFVGQQRGDFEECGVGSGEILSSNGYHCE
jgi:hypothetical protein